MSETPEQMRKRLDRQERHGHLAYEAYGESTNGLTYDGRQMPPWEDLSTRVQDAWRAAAAAVRMEVLSDGA